MRTLAVVAALAVALLAARAGLPANAFAAGSASRAVGFIEDAQNSDGGFGAKKGGASDPVATLWASAALLAAGKHPRDEFLKNGRSAEDYVVGHLGAYGSLEQLGLLALVQNTSRLGASAFGHPLDKISARLSESAVRADPRGVAFAIFGLLAADTPGARSAARSAAQSLLASTTSDGAWGPDGNADSASTAIVLQALAATGVANRDSPQVVSGFGYLGNAQINDGAIAESTRVDKASAGGSVAATAYAIQAVNAFGWPMIRTSTGKTLKQGLTDYQQQTSGGLTSRGGQYSQVPPSVVETSQAFPPSTASPSGWRRCAAPVAGPTPRASARRRREPRREPSTTTRRSARAPAPRRTAPAAAAPAPATACPTRERSRERSQAAAERSTRTRPRARAPAAPPRRTERRDPPRGREEPPRPRRPPPAAATRSAAAS